MRLLCRKPRDVKQEFWQKKTTPASAEVVTFVFLLAQVKIPVADWECAFKRSGLVLPDGIAFRHTGQIILFFELVQTVSSAITVDGAGIRPSWAMEVISVHKVT